MSAKPPREPSHETSLAKDIRNDVSDASQIYHSAPDTASDYGKADQVVRAAHNKVSAARTAIERAIERIDGSADPAELEILTTQYRQLADALMRAQSELDEAYRLWARIVTPIPTR